MQEHQFTFFVNLKWLYLLALMFLFSACQNDFQSEEDYESQKNLVDSLLRQSVEARNSNPLIIVPLADSAIDMAQKIQYRAGEINAMYHKATGYFFQNDFAEAESICDAIIEKSGKNIPGSLAKAKFLGSAYNLKGLMWQKKGEYEKAIQNLLLSLNHFETSSDTRNIASVYINMSENFRFLKDFERSLDYNLKAEEYFRQAEMYDRLSTVFQNRGNIYNNQGNYKEALEIFNLTLDSAIVHNDDENIASSLNNLGVSYEQMGKDEQALDYYFQAIDIYKARNFFWGEANTLGNISLIYLKRKNFNTALEISKTALKIARKNDFKELILFNYENLSRIYEEMGQAKKSLGIYKEISELKDSLYNEEKFRTISALEQQYLEEKSEKLIAQKDKELIQAQLNSKTLLIFVIILGVIIFFSLLIAFFLYKQVQLRNRKNEELRQKNEIIENKNREITRRRDEIKEQNEDLELLVNAYETHREKEIVIGRKKFFINDIIYIKYHNRISHIFFINGQVIEHRVQLSQLLSELRYKSNFLFAQINQNYIVNFHNVDVEFYDGVEEKFYFTLFLKNDHEEGRTEEYVKTRKRSGLNKNFEREFKRYQRLKNLLEVPGPSSSGPNIV